MHRTGSEIARRDVPKEVFSAPLTFKGIQYEKGAPAHSADPGDDSLRMVTVNSLPRQTFGLLQATSNSLRASTSLHSKNLLSHARLTQLPTGQHKSVGEACRCT